jgi:hypothetical protein
MNPRFAAIALFLLGTVSVVWADIPGPGPRPRPPVPAPVVADKSVPLVYEMTDGNGPAKLIIPKKFAGQMKAAIDLHSSDAVAENAPSRTPAILAGVFLTLSMAFSGLWVVRSRGLVNGRTVAMILAGVALLGLGGALLWANAPPPPNLKAAPPVVNGDRVIIEIVEQGEAVKMILPKNRMAGLVGAVPQPVPPGVRPPVAVPAPNPPFKVVPLPAPVPQPAPVKPIENGLNGAFAPGNPGIGVAAPGVAQPVLIKD